MPTNDCFISIVLDKRFQKSDGTYPVKLRVFTSTPRKQKLYSTVFAFTQKDFSSIWETTKPRSEHKENRLMLQALETKANETAKRISAFNFEDFERLMYGSTDTRLNVNYYFHKIIEKYTSIDCINTAYNYKNALSCLLRFHRTENIDFKEVTVSYLEKFEKFCVTDEEKSLTTVSMYTRCLRTVFNEAIAQKTIANDIYPFGKRKYQIKAPKKVKKALLPDQLKLLFESKPTTSDQEKAKAFWFFSYLCNGMNFKDILNLKCKDVEADTITFVRSKTEKSAQAATPITVYLNEYTLNVLNQYGNIQQKSNDYVFPVFNHSQTATEQVKRKNAFISYVNQHFLNYAKSLGINEPISTYYARHSFTTMSIRKGASIEFVGEALGHTDIKTTMNYFAGFGNETKREFGAKLLEF